MSAGAGSSPGAFHTAYASALRDHLREPTEASLRGAYELGREAVRRRLSVLDLAVIHHEAVVSELSETSGLPEVQRFMRAAGDFFLESLASFEMIQRGFVEVRQAFLSQRHQTAMSRQLSTFLADASLALEVSDSHGEMLRLVAEQARELVGADCGVATVGTPGEPRRDEAVSHPDADRRWGPFIRWLDLSAIYRLLRLSGGSIRACGEQLTALGVFSRADRDWPLHGWLAVSLTALDGHELGAIQLFNKPAGGFTADDEATLVHLAQMASAAAERAQLYRDGSS